MIRRLNKYRKQAARGESGFTLVEQVVTLAIVGMVLTAAMAALATGGLSLNVATSRNEAMSLAQAQMECIKNQSFVENFDDTTYVGPGKCDIATPSDYGLSTEVSVPSEYDTGGAQKAQKIVVTVSRGQNNVPVLVLEDLKVERP